MSPPQAAADTATAEDPRALPVTFDMLDTLRAEGAMPVDAFREASWWIALPPPPATWRRILDPLALILGIALLVAGVLYLVVFNWDGLGTVGKVAVGAAPVLGVGVLATLAGTQRLMGKVLTASGIPLTLGFMLAIGLAFPADGPPWVLLMLWAVLCVPWAIASRLAVSWIGVAIAFDIALYAMLTSIDDDPFIADLMVGAVIIVHLLAWGGLMVAGRLGVKGVVTWVKEALLAPAILLLAFWPIEAITVHTTDGAAWTPFDVLGILAFLVTGVGIHIGFGLGRVRPLPAAAQLLTLLAVVTAAMLRIVIALIDTLDFELAGLFVTVPMGIVVLLQLALSSGWLVWGWRRRQALGLSDENEPGWRFFDKSDPADITARTEPPAVRPSWWPRLDAVLDHLRPEGLLEGDNDDDIEGNIVRGVAGLRTPNPWYIKGALFGGGLMAGGVLACTCGPLATLSSGVFFLLPAVVVGIVAIGGRWGRPDDWAEWLDPPLFALMIAAELLLAVGLLMTMEQSNLFDEYGLAVFCAVFGVIQLAMLVVYPDRWHRTLGTIAVCGCFAGISYSLEVWPVRDVGTGLAILLGAAILLARPIFSGTPLREILAPVGLGFAMYGLGGMGRFWRGWADEGWIIVVGVMVGVLALGVVGFTLARVRAPAHGWMVAIIATLLLVALGTSMPALPVAMCFLLIGLLTRDAAVIVTAILALVVYGAWAYTAFDWPLVLKAGALLGSGGILLGLRAYLRGVVPDTVLASEDPA